ncbi:phosphonate ABC transporter [Cyanobium sp. AMD-g]|uniref:PhnE/PtxC family ABC transporter permease n=1 Tax=Cyanobium sp. AMD-g TaxID=2823699 RepID=UPI0020CEC422|nr:ABC transporter permease subunit [Cyanobium sp. AMD-g]MCP9930696.1 phosphonate ABC transporter [Cyanobium sp. AMD-g]
MKPAPPLLMLLPALVLVPLAVLLPPLVHGGGWELIGAFALAAVTPSLDPVVLASLLKGLAVTAGMALLGWAGSLVLGLLLGVASSRIVWRTLTGSGVPAELIRRLLALPRAIHELIWGLLLLQLVGLQPAVAVLAIALPFGALVARVLSDLLDALPTSGLEALRAAGAPAPAALLTALGPALLPGVLSYGGYRLECALRSATLLGVFGLGGLGTDLKLTLQSLEFHELWSGLWLLLAVMLALEGAISLLRRRWLLPGRFALARRGVGERSREMLLVLAALLPLCVLVGRGLGVDPAALLSWQPLPGLGGGDWAATAALPWPRLVGGTLLLTALAASMAVGLAPLLLLVVAPVGWARQGLRLLWALGRLWPPPLTALLLLFVLEPGVITAALALGFHNLGVLGRLLLESADATDPAVEEALVCGGSGQRLALLYGRFSALARPYLAYGAYRADVILRESVVVGLVGATGLGSQLLESLSSFAWDQLLALVAVYALLTLVGEDLSDRARHRWLRVA